MESLVQEVIERVHNMTFICFLPKTIKYEEKSMPDTDREPHSDSDPEDDDGLRQNDDKSDVGDVEIDKIFGID